MRHQPIHNSTLIWYKRTPKQDKPRRKSITEIRFIAFIFKPKERGIARHTHPMGVCI